MWGLRPDLKEGLCPLVAGDRSGGPNILCVLNSVAGASGHRGGLCSPGDHGRVRQPSVQTRPLPLLPPPSATSFHSLQAPLRIGPPLLLPSPSSL